MELSGGPALSGFHIARCSRRTMVLEAESLPRRAGGATAVFLDLIAVPATALQVRSAVDIVVDGTVAVVVLAVANLVDRDTGFPGRVDFRRVPKAETEQGERED